MTPPLEPIPYYPRYYLLPHHLLDVPSAWRGIENGLASILDDFLPSPPADRELCLEMGCDYGYSAAALSNFFTHTITVDIFQSEEGDPQTGYRDPDQFLRVAKYLEEYPVSVVKADFRDWIVTFNRSRLDCVHVDIIHEYQPTYEALRWSVDHTDLVLVHDTESFIDVRRACADVAKESGFRFYNWDSFFGLGILSKEGLR